MSERITYLGPSGTFTNDAALKHFGANATLVPLANVPDVLASVDDGSARFGVVPIENSVQGEVTTTMDALIFDHSRLRICGEVRLPVSFAALRRPGDASPPMKVLSHPHALAQCAKYVRRLGVPVQACASTAAACRDVAESSEPGLVAIASRTAGDAYGLTAREHAIEDHLGAQTRFFVVSRSTVPATGCDKTSVVVVPMSKAIGTLAEITSLLADHGRQVFAIHSRPTRTSLGTYAFFLTISGHYEDSEVRSALHAILAHGHRLKMLGSYPVEAEVVSPASTPALQSGFVDTAEALDEIFSRERS